jgi:hypothetical protein
MTADALGTPAPAATPTVGVVSDEDHRLALAGTIAPQTSDLAVRTGVMWGPGTTALISGTSATGTMTYSIAIHHAVTSRGTGDGVYLGPTLDAVTTVNTIAAPGSNSRIDVIYVKQNDTSSTISADTGTTQPIYGVVNGTAAVSPVAPSIPVGAIELGRATVSAGATSTNGSGVTISQTAVQTVARGADVPVRTLAERNALTQFVGLSVKRLDLGGLVQRWTGSVWAEGSDAPSFGSNSARDTYYSGNLRAGAKAIVGSLEQTYNGTKWMYVNSGRVLYTVGAPTTDAGGTYTFPHGLGVTPSNVQVTTTQQASDLLQRIGVVKVLNYDSSNIVVGFVRTDTSAYLASSLLSFDWEARS